MKIFATILIMSGLILISAAHSQEGNTAVSEFLRNEDAQELLRTTKNDPEAVMRAAQEDPDAVLKNAINIFSDQSKKDTGDPPATRSTSSQTDKSLSNLRKIFATPTNKNSTQAMPAEAEKALKDVKIDSSKLDQVKSAARDLIPGLTDKIAPNDPPAQPRVDPTPIPSMTSTPRTPTPPAPTVANLPPAPEPINRTLGQEPPSAQPLTAITPSTPPPAARNMQPTSQRIPDFPELYASTTPEPQPLSPRYAKPEKFEAPKSSQAGEVPKPEADTMVIESNSSEMDNNTNVLTFRGDVIVTMRGLEMKCDRLKVELDSEQKMERITATGGTVQVKRTVVGDNGKPKLQVAKAKKAVYVAATETTTLSGGPPYLQDGARYVNTDSESSRIVLNQRTGKYSVDNPEKQGRSVIVVPINGAKGLGDSLGIENKLQKLGQ